MLPPPGQWSTSRSRDVGGLGSLQMPAGHTADSLSGSVDERTNRSSCAGVLHVHA